MFSTLFYIFLIINILSFKALGQNCSDEEGLSIIFINGIKTISKKADDHLNKLRKLNLVNDNVGVEYVLAYNHLLK